MAGTPSTPSSSGLTLRGQSFPISLLILLGLALVALFTLSSSHTEVGMIPAHDVDEAAFLTSLHHMYEGLQHHSIARLFSFQFYNYGFGFFFLNLLTSLPFLAKGDDGGVLLAARLTCGITAIASVAVIFSIARRRLSANAATALAAVLLLMPGFWYDAVWFHPDWMMTFFLLVAFERLIADEGRFGREFWWGAAAFGASISVKQSAFTMLPGLLALSLVPWKQEDGTKRAGGVVVTLKAAAIAFGVFLITNPYLLVPRGLKAFLAMSKENVVSNKTNHYTGVHVGLAQKLGVGMQGFFIPVIVLFVLLIGGLFFAWKERTKPDGPAWVGLGVGIVCSLVYLLLGVNKDWQHYYLPFAVLTIAMGVPLLGALAKDARQQVGLALGLAAIQLICYVPQFEQTTVYYRLLGTPPSETRYELTNAFITTTLKGKLKPTDKVLVTFRTPFNYPALGIPAENVSTLGKTFNLTSVDPSSFAFAFPTRPASDFFDADYIVLAKDQGFWEPEKQHTTVPEAYQETNSIAKQLIGGILRYRVLAEGPSVYILERRDRP